MNSQPEPLSFESDVLQTFIFEQSQIRGEIVRLGASWQTILSRKQYPPAIQRHLGEMVAAGALLSATLKFSGTLIIQAQGTGLVRLLVVECTADLGLRATIKLANDVTPETIPSEASLAELINPDGLGKLVITLDPSNRQEGQQAYQGIVPLSLHGQPITSIAQAIIAYMNYSEQLDTKIWLACNHQFAGGILLQKLPQLGGHSPLQKLTEEELDEAWERLPMLVQTVKDAELLGTPPNILMNRLFTYETDQQTVRSFPLRHLQFSCQCSRKRVGNMLIMLGYDEVTDILEEQQQVETTCDFCGQVYAFDAVDCKQLFIARNLIDGMRPAKGKH